MCNHEMSLDEVDIIFAGGGVAACVAAGRLAQAAPNLKILIIERGKNNLNDPTVVHPALFLAHLVPDSQTTLFYQSRPSGYVGDREIVVPAGGMLGGGSSINLSMYTRAQAADYDAWQTPGWGADDMISLCNKAESYYDESSEVDLSNHGDHGPVKISSGGFRSKCENAILETIRQAGISELPDINDFSTTGGFMRIPRYVSPDGKRQDAAHCYIHQSPTRESPSPNIQILCDSTVLRVLFDTNVSPPRAIGVEVKATTPDESPPRALYARQLVVVSAGALGSPLILERSGIGSNTVLQRLGIDIVSDLPSVGENYQDHHLVRSSYATSLSAEETLESIATGRKDIAAAIVSKDPQLGWNGIDVAGKLRPRADDAERLGPEFFGLWKKDWAPYPYKPMIIMNFIHGYIGNPSDVAPDQRHLTIGCISLYPYSRGRIHITDTTGGYDFDSGFLNDEADVKMQVWGYKLARSLAHKLPFFEGEVAASHPNFAAGSSAAVKPSRESASKAFAYSAADDEVIEAWVRETVGTTWHSLGTCAMKPRDAGGVVDAHLNVYGTRDLKIADLSITPENIGANVGSTAFAVGEKAALIIAEELGLA
ncbi:putative alcohol oxidase [Nemania abortiva]|nr:putative alcohol oxidase [Nemania abortiva]